MKAVVVEQMLSPLVFTFAVLSSMIVDEDLFAFWDVDDCVYCKSLHILVPGGVRIRYATMVDAGCLQEYSPYHVPVWVGSHWQAVHIKSFSIGLTSARAEECLEAHCGTVGRSGVATVDNREEYLFVEDRSYTWNIPRGPQT